jgi:hypothetical protein
MAARKKMKNEQEKDRPIINFITNKKNFRISFAGMHEKQVITPVSVFSRKLLPRQQILVMPGNEVSRLQYRF